MTDKKIYVSYKDDNDKVISGFFNGVDIKDNLVIITTDKNIIKIPLNRLLKIKENILT